MIILKESQYWKEREVMIKLLKEELNLLWNDYQKVTDTICKMKIKKVFEQKESQLYIILKEELEWQ